MTRFLQIFTLIGVVLTALPATGSAQRPGRVLCSVTDNDEPASGSVEVQKEGKTIAHGRCGAPLEVPAGRLQALIELDGSLDRPKILREIEVEAGKTITISAGFETGTLEVNATFEGRPAAAMIRIERDGTRIATMASGVSGHLSVGSYDIVVRYRNKEKTFRAVKVERGKAQRLDVSL